MSNEVQSKFYQAIYIAILTINTIIINIDADIYVPSFPDILADLVTDEAKTQMILSANFLGVCIASLFYGPISDCIGRRKPLLIAQIIFIIGVIGSWQAPSIDILLFCRFFQGLGSAGMLIVSGTVIFDLFKGEKVIKLVSIWNSVGTGTMASAPLLGSFLNQYYGWRSNFLFVLIISVILLISSIVFFKETLNEKYHSKINFKSIFYDYINLTTHFPYVANSVICALMYSGIMVYTSNLSLLFINHYHIDEHSFMYYQFSSMFSFGLFSIICTKFVTLYGAENTKKIGVWLCNIGAIFLMLIAYYKPESAILICVAMSIFNAGVAFAIGIFGVYSISFFPQLKATAAALGTSYRLLITSTLVTVSAHNFNGTIMPIAKIILLLTAGVYVLYFTVQKPTMKLLKKN
jgi:DHA1 family bicyclomycin/chloramphenicol resistance-like MFS transporter